MDDAVRTSDTGFESFKYGISVYAPYGAESPHDPVQGVLAFEKGYFD